MNRMVKSIGAAVLLAFGVCGCGEVGTGERGVLAHFGRIDDIPELNEGLHFFNPVGGSISRYNIKNQKITLSTEQYTKDVQGATCEISVTYHLRPDRVKDMHQHTGPDYANILIMPSILGAMKNVMGGLEAQDSIGRREEATAKIKDAIVKKLEPYGIDVTLVELTDIGFKPQFEKAVEDKQISMQNAIRAKNETERIREEAQQKVIAAEAEAKAMEVRANALQKNKSLVAYEAVMRWDGKLPVQMLGSSPLPFFDTTAATCAPVEASTTKKGAR